MSKSVYARLVGRIRVLPESGCWDCAGWNTGNGYAKIRVNNSCRVAHKALYEERVGPVPAGHVLDHLCRRRSCVNPDHLEPVTIRENTRRGDAVLFGRNK